jgi:glycosyltransferase involved in cell wall biosynthesis
MRNLVNRLFALFGLALVRASQLDALRKERETSRQERDALTRNLASARQNHEAALSELYALRVKTDAPRKRGDRSRVSIIIPTINSESYIELILKYYNDLNINVHLLVDSKTSDKTFDVAKRYASPQIMDNTSGLIADDVMEEISKKIGTDWVLRLDDDELPSKSLLDFVYKIIDYDDIDVVGFRRYQCAVATSGIVLFSQEYDSDKQRQWRLYRPHKVQFIRKIHTPGFRRDRQRSIKAPDDAFMIHLDWAIHSYEERLLKIERYERHTPGSSNHWRPYYLYEEKPHRFGRLNAPEFDGLAKAISERFSDLCVVSE